MIENELKNYEFTSLEFNFRPLKILNLVHKNLSFDLIYGEVNADKPSLNFKFSNAFRYKNIVSNYLLTSFLLFYKDLCFRIIQFFCLYLNIRARIFNAMDKKWMAFSGWQACWTSKFWPS